MADGTVKFIFEGKDEVSPEAKKAGQAIEQVASKAKKSNEDLGKSFKQATTELRTFGRELNQLGRFVAANAAVITGGFAVSFQKARVEIPAVDNSLKDINRSFQDIANSLSRATLPTLQEFSRLLNGVAAGIREVATSNPAFLNSLLKFSAATVVFATLAFTIGAVAKALVNVFSLLNLFGTALRPLLLLLGGGSLGAGLAWAAGITAAVFALIKLVEYLKQFQALSQAVTSTWQFFGKLLDAIGNYTIKLFRAIGLGFVIDGLEKAADKVKDLGEQFAKFKEEADEAWRAFQEGTKKAGEKVEVLSEQMARFGRGFKSQLKTLGESFEAFGQEVEQILERHLGDTLFDAITGRIKTTKDLLKSLGEDLLRAFTGQVSNQLIGGLFGNKEGGSGVFGGLFSFFSNPKGSGEDSRDRRSGRDMQDFNKQVVSTTHNFGKFQEAKDATMAKMIDFGKLFVQLGAILSNGVNFLVQGFMNAVSILGQAISSFVGWLGSILGSIGGGKKSGGLLGTILGIGGSILGSVLPGIGTAIGGFIGSTVGNLFGGGGGGGGGLVGALGPQNGAFSPEALGNTQFLSEGGAPTITFDNIPKLAKGGIITQPTLAMVGESGPEAVIPLSSKVGAGGGGAITVSVKIDKAMLNTPANIDAFVQKLSEQLFYLVDKGQKRTRTASG